MQSAPCRNVWSGYLSGKQGCRQEVVVVLSRPHKAARLRGKRERSMNESSGKRSSHRSLTTMAWQIGSVVRDGNEDL